MKGDFTRWTFAGDHHYRAVLAQQGRVQLDADWNEQVELQAHLDRLTARDTVGATGTPIDPVTGSSGMQIVDARGGPPKAAPTSGLWITGGRYYVDGVLCENAATCRLVDQPDLPGDPSLGPGDYLAYLDVWEEHVTALEQSRLLEVALGGVTTTTRARTVWQVRLRPDGSRPPARSSARLAARAVAPPTDTDPACPLPLSARYRRLENQLYRVEVLDPTGGLAADGATVVGPTVVWSRENGSVAARLVAMDGNVLTVDRVGLDDRLTFATDPLPWVEVTDSDRVQRGQPGFLGLVGAVDGTRLTITRWHAGAAPVPPLGPDAVVRRWDSPGAVAVVPGTWTALEDGVEILFDGGSLATGDYWQIPARTAALDRLPVIPDLDGNVDWPFDAAGPVAVAAHGVAHRYADLALLRYDGKGWTAAKDLRQVFRPLTDLDADAIRFRPGACAALVGTTTVDEALHRLAATPVVRLVSGEGQIGAANAALGGAIVVEVRDGCGGLLVNESVTFAVVDGALAPVPPMAAGGPQTVTVPIDGNGRASCVWRLGATPVLQTLTARLVDRPGLPPAAAVSVVAGVRAGSPFAPGVHVTGVGLVAAPGVVLGPRRQVTPADLAAGIEVTLDDVPDPATVDGTDVLRVTLGLPFPANSADQATWGGVVVGRAPVELGGQCLLVTGGSGSAVIRWTPVPAVTTLLGTLFARVPAAARGDALPCRVVLSGRSVATTGGRVLNGFVPTVVTAGGPALALPSSDAVAGGDFELELAIVEKISGLVVVPFAGSPLAKSAREALGLTMDRGAVTATLPAGITLAPGAPPTDLTAARRAVGNGFRNRSGPREITVVVDPAYEAAVTQMAVDVGAAGLTLTVVPAADVVAEVQRRLAAGDPVDGVVTDAAAAAAATAALPGAQKPVDL